MRKRPTRYASQERLEHLKRFGHTLEQIALGPLLVHRWFGYNIRIPRLQAAGRPLYSEGDPMATALEPSRNLDCSNKAHALVASDANNDPLLII